MKNKQSRSTGNNIFDKLLLPRIENYGSNNELDIDDTVDYLRTSYKEYQRHKIGPFKAQVARAIDTITKRGGVPKPELRLQALEGKYLDRQQRGGEQDGSDSDSDPESGNTDDSSEDLDIEVTNSMNRSMANLYANDGGPTTSAGKTEPDTSAPMAVTEPAGKTAAAAATTPAPASQPSSSGRPTTAAPSGSKRGGGAGRSERGLDKRPRTASARTLSAASTPSAVTYADLGGIESVLDDVRELIEFPLKHPEVYSWLGVDPPRGVLLHGPPGCGKTALANAIANQCNVPFLRVSAPEVVSGMSGESEAKIRQLFQEAAAIAPCIIFIDEIDAIAPKRENAQRQMEHRIVAQMLTCMDDLTTLYKSDVEVQPESSKVLQQAKHVVVIGATNRPDALDTALRRAGRFDREISLNIPGEKARAAILEVLCRRLRLSGDFDLSLVAKKTPGFVGADLAALTKEAAALAVKRIFSHIGGLQPESLEPASSVPAAPPQPQDHPLTTDQLAGLAITMKDFEEAVSKVQPSVRREGFTTTPDVTWEDVGSLLEVREELSFAITRPIRHPELFEAMGLRAASGVLLFGPPGCGKTLVAKAAANESGANFISIKGPELLNKYVGESERAVRQLFSRARAAAPCVLFFDEMDALAPRRGSDSGNQSAERLVNQLLTEMDGVDGRQGVFVVAATNRPDIIDPALLRPGRLDRILYVPLPTPEGRVSILEALTRKTPLATNVDIQALGASPALTGFSGADVAALVREACVESLKERLAAAELGQDSMSLAAEVSNQHFQAALRRVQPSVSRKDQRMYDALRLRLRRSRGHLRPEGEQLIGEGDAVTGNPVAHDENEAALVVLQPQDAPRGVIGADGVADMEGSVVSEPMEAEDNQPPAHT